MNHFKGIFGSVVLLAFCASSGVTNYYARHDLPIRLPKETLDFLKNLTGNLKDINIDLKKPPTDWLNPPVAPGTSGVAEDDLFIVRYPSDKAGLGAYILKEAHNNIALLEDLFGWYPLPHKYFNRRLEINLYESEGACGENCPKGTLGLINLAISPSHGHAFIEGIHLNPILYSNWSKDGSQKDELAFHRLATVLRHEMAHAAYFSGLSMGNQIRHPHWVVEGIAEYAGESTWRLEEKHNSAQGMSLQETSNTQSYNDYWMGYTAHLGLECWKGKKFMDSYASKLLASPSVSAALKAATSGNDKQGGAADNKVITLNEWDLAWRGMVDKGIFNKVPPPGTKFTCAGS